MSIVRWTPVTDVEEMRRGMEQLFEEFLEPAPRRRRVRNRPGEAVATVPNIDLYDMQEKIILKVEVPGVEKDDIDLSITDNNLTLKAVKKRGEEVKEEDYFAAEIAYGPVSRSIPLPVEIDSSGTKASFRNGILEIVLSKKEEAKPQEIKVEIA